MKKVNMHRLLFFACLSFCVQGLWAAGAFNSADVREVRRIADQLAKPSEAMRNTFLSKCQAMVAALKDATPQERVALIASMEDAQFGGLMDEIVSTLKTLIATAKATPAGGSSASGTSASSSVPNASSGYLDRIKALNDLIDTFRYKSTVSDAEKDQMSAFFAGLYNDRGESFKDELAQVPALINKAIVLVYRNDSSKIAALTAMRTNFGQAVDFATYLQAQKKLYSVFTPLNKDQATRLLRLFKEMAQLLGAINDAAQIEDFKNLLNHVDVKFFYNDAAMRAELVAIIKAVDQYDPFFIKPYAEIIVALKTSASSVLAADIPGFIDRVKKTVEIRYGTRSGDDAAKSANISSLNDLLTTLLNSSAFSAYTQQITAWSNLVKQDLPAASSSSTTSSNTGNEITVGSFDVSFDDALDAQITKLEQSLPAAVSANHKELFILSLYNAVQRQSTATTQNVNRMKKIITDTKAATNFGGVYVDFCTFLEGFINNSPDATVRNRAFLDFIVRVASMSNITDRTQQEFITLAAVLLRAFPDTLSSAQLTGLQEAVQSASSRNVFSRDRSSLLSELLLYINRKINDAGITSTTNNSTDSNTSTGSTTSTGTGSSTSTSASTGSSTSSGSSSSTGSSTSTANLTKQQRAELQRQAARAFLNSKNWR
ncbi:hypothetical protein FJ366_02875 [Candidatus Dependentiae bacterium]|nr:hypothetical protein [Candidatus Dependentiae bacterium]